MEQMSYKEIIDSCGDENMLFADGFADAIFGVSSHNRVIYNMDKILDKLMNENNWDYEDAIDFADYNIFNCTDDYPYPIFARLK